jgi:aarF domain-containing kinase
MEELGQLYYNVPAFPTPQAIAIIEAELEQPLHELFTDFTSTPVAAASIGQVGQFT